MKRCVIVGGADIQNYEHVRSYIKPTDFLIYCDSGLKHREALAKEADLIVGDFDSYKQPQTAIETIVLPCIKDDTDTVYAVKEAIKRGYRDFVLIGVLGGRMDHSLGNLSVLSYLEKQGLHGIIVDDYGEMKLLAPGRVESISSDYEFFSLLAVNGDATGVCIENAKYPLKDAVITGQYQYGVSNEVLPGENARVSLTGGELILIKIKKIVDGD